MIMMVTSWFPKPTSAFLASSSSSSVMMNSPKNSFITTTPRYLPSSLSSSTTLRNASTQHSNSRRRRYCSALYSSTAFNGNSSISSNSNINTNSPSSSVRQISSSSSSSQSPTSRSMVVNLEPLVICGPSGVGKGTVIQGLIDSYKPKTPFGFCVSHTTRSPRPGEQDGIHYYFTSIDDIQIDIQNGKFIEHAIVHGNYYGTSYNAIEHVQSQNQIAILDIDVQGVRTVQQSFLKSGTPCKYVFMTPPSMEELERRLRGRQTETEESIQRRLGNAANEIQYGTQSDTFDYILVNDNVEQSVQDLIDTLSNWYPQLLH